MPVLPVCDMYHRRRRTPGFLHLIEMLAGAFQRQFVGVFGEVEGVVVGHINAIINEILINKNIYVF